MHMSMSMSMYLSLSIQIYIYIYIYIYIHTSQLGAKVGEEVPGDARRQSGADLGGEADVVLFVNYY